MHKHFCCIALHTDIAYGSDDDDYNEDVHYIKLVEYDNDICSVQVWTHSQLKWNAMSLKKVY